MEEGSLKIIEETKRHLTEHAELCAKEGRWDLAERAFFNLYDLEENAENSVNYAVSLWENGKQEEAFSQFVKSVEIDSSNGDALVNLVESGYALKKFEHVETVLAEAIERGTSIDVYPLLADCRAKQDKLEGSVATITEMLTKDPQHIEAVELLQSYKDALKHKNAKSA